MATYRVSVWDHEAKGGDGGWERPHRYAGITKWGLRAVIRELRGQAWDAVTVLIERED